MVNSIPECISFEQGEILSSGEDGIFDNVPLLNLVRNVLNLVRTGRATVDLLAVTRYLENRRAARGDLSFTLALTRSKRAW